MWGSGGVLVTSVVHSELAIESAASDPIGLLLPPMVAVTLRVSSLMSLSLSVDCTIERSPLVRMIATGRAIGGNIGGNIVL